MLVKSYFICSPPFVRWQERRNGVRDLEKKHIGYENGVLGGLLSALNVFCSKGDHVLLNSPTYIGFTKSLANNGYRAVHSPLYLDEENVWRMDYEDMEKKIVEYKIHAAVFCSPYNPVADPVIVNNMVASDQACQIKSLAGRIESHGPLAGILADALCGDMLMAQSDDIRPDFI